MGIATSDKPFTERIKDAEADKFMRASVAKAQDAQFQKRTEARRQLGHWEGWRDLSAEIRQHVIKHLPDYLEEFSDNVQKNGGHVFFAKDGDEASTFIKQLAIKTY